MGTVAIYSEDGEAKLPYQAVMPTGITHSKPSILWDKDGNPSLPGIGRGKPPLSSETAMLGQFVPLSPEPVPTHT